MTKKELTLKIIKDAGGHGIHSFDLIKQVGTHKVTARVSDLKKDGYVISSVPEKRGRAMGVRYYYVGKNVYEPIEKKPVRWEFHGNIARPIYE